MKDKLVAAPCFIATACCLQLGHVLADWGSLGLTIFAAVLKQLGSVAAAVSAKIWDEAFTMFLSVGLLDRSSLGFVGGAIHSERQF